MARFTYKSVRRDGKHLESELETPDEGSAIRQIQKQDLIPIRVRRAGGLGDRTGRRPHHTLTTKEIALFTRELSTLLESGLTLGRSLRILIRLSSEERIVRALKMLQEQVRGGATFAADLEGQAG